MKDRFNLEDEILRLYSFVESIESVSNFLMESEDIDDDLCDKSVNALNGISALMTIHIQTMFDTMRQVHKLDQYCDQ